MTEIKVIGDILSGKFQPTLTGNRIVDAALIDHFCQNLAKAVNLPTTAIQAEHHWDLTIAPHQLYLVDDQILEVDSQLRANANVIAVAHKDLLRGQIATAQHALTKQLSLHATVK